LPLLVDVTSHRASSWDRSGGNDDFAIIAPGAVLPFAEIAEPGVIRHLWLTAESADQQFLRKVVLRAFWDGEATPSIEVTLGDFFGMGHAMTRTFWSLPLQMSPEDGRGFNCWFPMPFDAASISVENQADRPVTLFFYVDYELTGVRAAPDLGRFHAEWRRQACVGIEQGDLSDEAFLRGGTNLTGDDNYVVLEAEGRGHYVGCNLNIENRRDVPLNVFNWYGEGDDMIFVDGEPFPPSLHGTGTEDFFNAAFCPTEAYSSPYHGIILPGGRNWSGRMSLYRFHLEDPIRFRTSIRVTIEHGHANRRSDDYSSTAYWYQTEPHRPFPALPPVEQRLPGA
jgi:hypothetical protein